MSAAPSRVDRLPRRLWWKWEVRFSTWVRILALLPAVIFAAEFARQYVAFRAHSADIGLMRSAAESDRALAAVIHAMQAERGRSVLRLSRGATAGPSSGLLTDARRALDRRLAAAGALAQTGHRGCCLSASELSAVVARLDGLRRAVDGGADPMQAFHQYSLLVRTVFSLQSALNQRYAGFERRRGTGIESTMLWVRALLDLKEVVGQQRALVGLALVRGSAGTDALQSSTQLLQLMAQEQEVNTVFRSAAPPEILDRLTDRAVLDEDRRMRDIRDGLIEALARGEGREFHDPRAWFDLATAHMDRLESLVGGLYDAMQRELDAAKIRQLRELREIGATALGLTILLLGLSLAAERQIAAPLRRIAAIIQQLNRRDLAVDIPYGERRDEIGQISRILHAFKGEIVRSRRLWRREFALMEASIDAIVVIDPAGRIIEFNGAAERMFNIPRAHALHAEMTSLLIPPRHRDTHLAGFARHLAGGEPAIIGNRIETQGWRDGAEFPVELTITRAEEEGETVFVAYIRDITERKAQDAELRKLVVGLEHNPASVVITDAYGHIEYVNPAFIATTGFSREEALGKYPSILRSGQTGNDVYAELWKTIYSGRTWRGQFSSRRKSGEVFWQYAVISPVKDDDGRVTNYFGILEDISGRKEAESRLEYQARYDRLTGLPNRSSALHTLSGAIDSGDSARIGVLAVNVDSLSKVNERFGIEIGDLVLLEFSHRLSECVGDRGSVARLEGGTFLVLMPERPATVEAMAKRILESGSFRYSLDDAEAFLTCRIGIAVYPIDGTDASRLLREAHVALQRAKLAGGNRYKFFSAGMDEESAAMQRFDSALRRGLERDEFRLAYQPIFVTRTRALAAVEALVRWTSADLGAVGPDRFIPLAEQNGFIRPLGAWILREACRQAAGWSDAEGQGPVIAVNVSADQFAEPGFVDRIAAILAETALSPDRLEIEVTERLLLGGDGQSGHVLDSLRNLSLRLSIDDFGTGYSALSYLSQHHFHTLKIDRSFVGKMATSRKDLALVETIIAMAHSMGIRVIAEGVETEEQFDMLKALECDFVQGYLLSRPLPAEQIDQFVRSFAGAAGSESC